MWTIAHQAPLSMGISRQEYWNGLPCPSPGNLTNPGIEPMSHHVWRWQADSLPLAPAGKPQRPYKQRRLGHAEGHQGLPRGHAQKKGHLRTQQEGSHLRPRREAAGKPSLPSPWAWTSSLHDTEEKKCLLLSHPVCGVLLPIP